MECALCNKKEDTKKGKVKRKIQQRQARVGRVRRISKQVKLGGFLEDQNHICRHCGKLGYTYVDHLIKLGNHHTSTATCCLQMPVAWTEAQELWLPWVHHVAQQLPTLSVPNGEKCNLCTKKSSSRVFFLR